MPRNKFADHRGFSLVESLMVASILLIVMSLVVQMRVMTASEIRRAQEIYERSLAVTNVLNIMRFNGDQVQVNFAGVTDYDTVLAYDNLPYTFDKKGVRKLADCGSAESCVNRMGFVVQPVTGLAGTYLVHMRTYQRIARLQDPEMREYNFVYNR